MCARSGDASLRIVVDDPTAPRGHVPGIDGHRAIAISPNGGLRAALRALEPLLGSQTLRLAATAPPLERSAFGGDVPTVSSCIPLEEQRSRLVSPFDVSGISAFLDGVQRSRVLGHVDSTPIIFATVAAAVRERRDRRLEQWGDPSVHHLILTSRALIGESAWAALEASGVAPVDLSEGNGGDATLHPLAVRAQALVVVAQEREGLERRLAEDWCRSEERWLWVDGGISGGLAIQAASPAFGVVKSHHTLYGDESTMRTTLALPVGARSPLFLVQHRARRAVASWYLRLHQSPSGDPLYGLVRVEVAPPHALFQPHDSERARPDVAAVHALATRADTISAWVLSERAPLALPDGRWDTLTYGVYACEQYLKAVIGS